MHYPLLHLSTHTSSHGPSHPFLCSTQCPAPPSVPFPDSERQVFILPPAEGENYIRAWSFTSFLFSRVEQWFWWKWCKEKYRTLTFRLPQHNMESPMMRTRSTNGSSSFFRLYLNSTSLSFFLFLLRLRVSFLRLTSSMDSNNTLIEDFPWGTSRPRHTMRSCTLSSGDSVTKDGELY